VGAEALARFLQVNQRAAAEALAAALAGLITILAVDHGAVRYPIARAVQARALKPERQLSA